MAEGGMISFVSDREKELECAICMEQITDAKLLKCLHTFCEDCLVKLENHGALACPTCRATTDLPKEGVKGLTSNFLFNRIKELIEAQGRSNCNNCEAGRIVKFYCFDCKHFYCDRCTDYHNKVKSLTDGHYVVELGKFSRKDYNTFVGRSDNCKKHEKEELKFYCQNCDECICITCTVVEHQNHQRSYLNDVVKQQKEDLEKKMVQIKAKKNRMEFHCKVLDDQVSAIKNEAEKAKSSARETFAKILKETEKQMQETLDEIDKRAESGICKVTNKKRVVLEKQEKVDNCVKFSKDVLDRACSSEIMELKGVLKKRFQELNHDTPKQYTVEPFHIKYVINDTKFQDGKEAIHQIGRVETCFTDPSFTQLEGEGVTAATVGQEAQFAVITKTNDGKVPTDPEDCVTVEIESPTASGHSKSIQANVTQQGNGRYGVTYTPTCCGEHKVHVWVNGEAITDSPRTLKVKKHRKKNKLSCQAYYKSDGPAKSKNPSPQANCRPTDRLWFSKNADEPVEKGCGAETWSCDRCTYLNSDYLGNCASCASPRGVLFEPSSPGVKPC